MSSLHCSWNLWLFNIFVGHKALAVSPRLLVDCDFHCSPVESFQLAANQYHKPLERASVFGVMPLAFYWKEKRWAKLDKNLPICQIQAMVYKTTQVKVDFTVSFQSHRKSLGVGNCIQILPVNIILYFFSFLLATHACQSIFLKYSSKKNWPLKTYCGLEILPCFPSEAVFGLGCL